MLYRERRKDPNSVIAKVQGDKCRSLGPALYCEVNLGFAAAGGKWFHFIKWDLKTESRPRHCTYNYSRCHILRFFLAGGKPNRHLTRVWNDRWKSSEKRRLCHSLTITAAAAAERQRKANLIIVLDPLLPSFAVRSQQRASHRPRIVQSDQRNKKMKGTPGRKSLFFSLYLIAHPIIPVQRRRCKTSREGRPWLRRGTLRSLALTNSSIISQCVQDHILAILIKRVWRL